jgi:chitodextrinase
MKRFWCVTLVFAVLQVSCDLSVFYPKEISEPPAPPAPDTSPPAEVSAFAGTAGDGEVTLAWIDPPDADFDHIEIAFTPEEGEQPRKINKGKGTVTITGLANQTAYTFTVKTVDLTGNVSAGAEGLSLLPEPAPDLTPPAEVTAFAGTAGDGEVTLTWIDPPDTDLDHIEITFTPAVGGQPRTINRGAETVTITGLTNKTAYAFKAKTVDLTGNISAGTASLTLTPMIAHTDTYIVASIAGYVKRTTTTTNNTDAMEFLARKVPYLYDEDEAIHYYASPSSAPLINDLFFRAASDTYYFLSNSFPYSSYSIYAGNIGYDGLNFSNFLAYYIFSPNHLPPMEQENLLFNGGTFNITDMYGSINFQTFTPAGMRNETVNTTETITADYRFDDFALPYNGSYDIPQDTAYNQDVPVTLYTRFTATQDMASYSLLKTLHYYETLDTHVVEKFETMNRAVYKTVTVHIDNALTVDGIQTSSTMVDSFSQTGNAVTFILKDYLNPMKFEIARITTLDEATGEKQMKILQLK